MQLMHIYCRRLIISIVTIVTDNMAKASSRLIIFRTLFINCLCRVCCSTPICSNILIGVLVIDKNYQLWVVIAFKCKINGVLCVVMFQNVSFTRNLIFDFLFPLMRFNPDPISSLSWYLVSLNFSHALIFRLTLYFINI